MLNNNNKCFTYLPNFSFRILAIDVPQFSALDQSPPEIVRIIFNNSPTEIPCNSLTKHFRPYLNRIKSVHFGDRYLMLKFGNKSVGHPV